MTTKAYKITLSQYTSQAYGGLVHGVTIHGMPVIAPTKDAQFAASYARELFHAHQGQTELWAWNGDAGIETKLDAHT